MRVLILGLSCLLLTSCATNGHGSAMRGAAFESWQGKKLNEVSAALGSPVFTQVQVNGNTSYTYVTRSVAAYVPPVNSEIATVALPHGGAIGVSAPAVRTNAGSTLVECLMTLETNKQGIIIAVKKRGSGC